MLDKNEGQKTVLLLCGLPGAGKSSVSAEWATADSGVEGIEYDHVQDDRMNDCLIYTSDAYTDRQL